MPGKRKDKVILMKATNAMLIWGISLALLSGPLPPLRAQSVSPVYAPADNSSAFPTTGKPAASALGQARLVIEGGDLLEVTVFDTPEMNQVVRVSDLGDATFLLIGTIHVANMTTDQARETISQKLRDGKFMLNPQVSVLIKEYATQGVSILGEVSHPGVYQVLGDRTLLDLLSEAGGTTPVAGAVATVKRHADGTEFAVAIGRNAKAALAADVQVKPGDKVIIPRANLVYGLGDVNRPGAFLMENDGHLSALQALAFAGGNERTAALNRVVLVHKDGANYVRRELSLKRMLQAREADLQLQPDDILFVPNSNIKSVVYRGVPNLVQAAANAAVYANMP